MPSVISAPQAMGFTKVWVGRIPCDVSSDLLRDALTGIGVEVLTLFMNRRGGGKDSSAIVNCGTIEDAASALFLIQAKPLAGVCSHGLPLLANYAAARRQPAPLVVLPPNRPSLRPHPPSFPPPSHVLQSSGAPGPRVIPPRFTQVGGITY